MIHLALSSLYGCIPLHSVIAFQGSLYWLTLRNILRVFEKFGRIVATVDTLKSGFTALCPEESLKLQSARKGKFVVQAKRWVVERTFGWFEGSRRLSKEYEELPRSSEAFIYICMIRIMVRRVKHF